MENPLFSIIIPTYNRSGFILKTIDSLLNQKFKDFEIIVVDDGSTDNTKEIIREIIDPRLKYFYKENGERGAARNFGINNSKGKYVTFLDSDDLLYPNHLEEAFSFIKKNNPIIFHQQYDMKEGKKRKLVSIESSIQKALIKGNPLSCMGVFIKREIALKDLFIEDRKISGSEDYELWLRYASKYPFLYNPICTSSLIIHNERSVYHFNVETLIERKLLMLEYAFSDANVLNVFGSKKSQIYASAYTYISLHLAMNNNKLESIKYLLKALTTHPLAIIERRSLAILKYLLK